jgi:4-amino-4-deoxy-L-arabinose transferase-like glycosyltransferase
MSIGRRFPITPRSDTLFDRPGEKLLLVSLLVLYVLMGLIGHDPWKPDEGYVFGIIYSFLRTGDWVVPTLAGQPFMEKPPLYYLTAAGSARLFQPWLDPVNGARLASGLFTAITLFCSGWAAKRLWGPGYGIIGSLMLASAVGLLEQSHYLVTDIALLSGFSLASCAFVIMDSQPCLSGLLLGLGVGVGFLAKGLLAPGVLGITALILPIIIPHMRSRAYLKTLLTAALVAAPWLFIWPTALYFRSPKLFVEWFFANNFGRLFGTSGKGGPNPTGYFLYTLLWFAWPLWPLAFLSAYRRRISLLQAPAVRAHIVFFVVLLSVLLFSATARPFYALPLLLPLCLLATREARNLSATLSLGIDWGCRIFFGGLALAAWAMWSYMQLMGHPPSITLLARHLSSSFKPDFEVFPFAVAVVVTLFWLLLLFRFRSHPVRALVSWVAGVTLFWSLLSTLLLPWIDDAKGYRAVMASLRNALPADHGCIASRKLGETERAMADYFAHIITEPVSEIADANCRLLLLQETMGRPDLPGEGWTLLWHGHRPADRRKSFWLFQKKKRICSRSVALEYKSQEKSLTP